MSYPRGRFPPHAKLLGHKDVSTTEIYTHVLNRGPLRSRALSTTSPSCRQTCDLYHDRFPLRPEIGCKIRAAYLAERISAHLREQNEVTPLFQFPPAACRRNRLHGLASIKDLDCERSAAEIQVSRTYVMRIVTWNMGCGPRSKYRRTHDAAWRYVLEQVQPDVALVQEAMLSCEDFVRPFGSVVWSRDRTRDSGTAVVVKNGIDFASGDVSVPGSFVAVATLSISREPIEVASVHVGPPNYRKNLVELRSWVVDDLLSRGSCVIGGDFNSSRSIAPWHLKYLTELSAAGLHDCHWSLHGREMQSFWGHQAKSAYQDDHLFTSAGLAKAVRSCQVHDTPDIRALSDHGPVTLELELPAG